MSAYRKSGPTPLKAVVDEIVRKFGWEEEMRTESVRMKWAEIVGASAAKVSTVKNLDENGVLSVRVDSPVWKSEIWLRRNELVKKLNDKLGYKIIKELNVR